MFRGLLLGFWLFGIACCDLFILGCGVTFVIGWFGLVLFLFAWFDICLILLLVG